VEPILRSLSQIENAGMAKLKWCIGTRHCLNAVKRPTASAFHWNRFSVRKRLMIAV